MDRGGGGSSAGLSLRPVLAGASATPVGSLASSDAMMTPLTYTQPKDMLVFLEYQAVSRASPPFPRQPFAQPLAPAARTPAPLPAPFLRLTRRGHIAQQPSFPIITCGCACEAPLAGEWRSVLVPHSNFRTESPHHAGRLPPHPVPVRVPGPGLHPHLPWFHRGTTPLSAPAPASTRTHPAP